MPALFLRKSNSTFSWPICLYSSPFSVSDCWRICSRPLPKMSGKTSQRLLLPTPDLGRMDAVHVRDLGRRLMRLDGLHGDLGLQTGWVTLANFRY